MRRRGHLVVPLVRPGFHLAATRSGQRLQRRCPSPSLRACTPPPAGSNCGLRGRSRVEAWGERGCKMGTIMEVTLGGVTKTCPLTEQGPRPVRSTRLSVRGFRRPPPGAAARSATSQQALRRPLLHLLPAGDPGPRCPRLRRGSQRGGGPGHRLRLRLHHRYPRRGRDRGHGRAGACSSRAVSLWSRRPRSIRP